MSDNSITIPVSEYQSLLATAQDHARMAEQLANREATMDSPFKLPAPDNYETTVGELYHSRQACKELSDEWDAKCKTLQADLTALHGELTKVRKLLPVVTKEGIGFGNSWISFDAMMGLSCADEETRKRFYKSNPIAIGLLTWANSICEYDKPCSPTPGSE